MAAAGARKLWKWLLLMLTAITDDVEMLMILRRFVVVYAGIRA